MTSASPPVPVAVYARNGTLAHVALGDSDATLCGRQRGKPAPAVTCPGCVYRYAQTPEGRKVARAAADQAIRDHLNAIVSPVRQALAALQQPEPDPAQVEQYRDQSGQLRYRGKFISRETAALMLLAENSITTPPQTFAEAIERAGGTR